MSDFYITLPSHSSKSEFPENKANSFKIRLPNPLRLEGHGWKVGLFSISLPDARVKLTSLMSNHDKKVGLFVSSWRRIEPRTSRGYSYGNAYFDTDDLKNAIYHADGVGLMKSMIAFFERQRVFKYDGPKLGSQYVTSDGKRTYIRFKWEGEDLVTDNENTVRSGADLPSLLINVDLALKMGWLQKNSSGYVLGLNLQLEFFNDEIPKLSAVNGDVFGSDGVPVFWKVVAFSSGGVEYLRLSIHSNWRFMNLNEAFRTVEGNKSRSLFIYSNVCKSGVVGNQVTDVLRVVNSIRSGAGTQYFEPTHIQYIPVRNDVLDIIEVQVAGQLEN